MHWLVFLTTYLRVWDKIPALAVTWRPHSCSPPVSISSLNGNSGKSLGKVNCGNPNVPPAPRLANGISSITDSKSLQIEDECRRTAHLYAPNLIFTSSLWSFEHVLYFVTLPSALTSTFFVWLHWTGMLSYRNNYGLVILSLYFWCISSARLSTSTREWRRVYVWEFLSIFFPNQWLLV